MLRNSIALHVPFSIYRILLRHMASTYFPARTIIFSRCIPVMEWSAKGARRSFSVRLRVGKFARRCIQIVGFRLEIIWQPLQQFGGLGGRKQEWTPNRTSARQAILPELLLF
jgi:hypothetical protein